MVDNFSCHQWLYISVVLKNCHLEPIIMVHVGRQLGHIAVLGWPGLGKTCLKIRKMDERTVEGRGVTWEYLMNIEEKLEDKWIRGEGVDISSHSKSKVLFFLAVLSIEPGTSWVLDKYSLTENTCPRSKGRHNVGSLNYCGFRNEGGVASASVQGIPLPLHRGLCTLGK